MLAATPPNVDFCIGTKVAKAQQPLDATQKRDQFRKALHLGYLNLKRH